MDYRSAYLILFNAITDSLISLQNTSNILIESQKKAEDIFLDTETVLFPFDKDHES